MSRLTLRTKLTLLTVLLALAFSSAMAFAWNTIVPPYSTECTSDQCAYGDGCYSNGACGPSHQTCSCSGGRCSWGGSCFY